MALVTLRCCGVCADALVAAGGERVEGEIPEASPCQFHRGPPAGATSLVSIERDLMPEPPEEEPIEPSTMGPVTTLAARFLAAWSGPQAEPSPEMIARSVSTARRLLRETNGD